MASQLERRLAALEGGNLGSEAERVSRLSDAELDAEIAKNYARMAAAGVALTEMARLDTLTCAQIDAELAELRNERRT